MTLRLAIGARSDVGLVREHNEDSLYAGRRLLAVADGIGGAVAGEVASAVTIAALTPLEADHHIGDVLGELRQSVHAANTALRERIEADPQLNGMGTTLTAMLWQDERLGLAHVGDSRGYLVRGGELSQITRDQTFVQLLVDEGRISAEQAASHPQRSVILNALDGRDEVEPDLSMRDVEPGDRYLLCSDGLSDYVDPAMLASTLVGNPPQPTCDRLVQLALEAGAPDNVSVIVADVVDDDATQRLTVTDQQPELPIVGGAAAELSPDQTARPAHRARHAESGRGLGRRLGFVAAAVVVLLAATVVGVLIWVRHQWYVATANPGGTVGVYQGVRGSALGHKLSHLQSPTDIPVTALPEDQADRVRSGIDASSHDNAVAIVATLRHAACPVLSPSPTPSPTPSRVAKHKPAKAPTPAWCLP